MATMNKVDLLDCAAGHHHFDDAGECSVCGYQGEPDTGDCLIAAAPDMLAALRQLDGFLSWFFPKGPDQSSGADLGTLNADVVKVWKSARDAIAKAEGREG